MKNTEGRVVIKVDVESKNSHRFEDGTVIRLERQFDQFNRRISEPVNAEVISAEKIPKGSEILISHNALHESNRVYDYNKISGAAEASNIRIFSLPEQDCYAWRDESGVLKPLTNFAFGLRLYQPYNGVLSGIENKVIPDVLFVLTGELKNKVVHTLKASDYQIIFQGVNGKEDTVIRFRHFENEVHEREEVLAINWELTQKVLNGELLVGYEASKAKNIKEFTNE